MNESPERQEGGLDRAADLISGAVNSLGELMQNIAETVESSFESLAASAQSALDSLQLSEAWIDLFGEPTEENIDHVSASVTAGAIGHFHENPPRGERARTVYNHLFDNLQERFRVVDGGFERQIYSIDCLGNTHDHHVGGSEHSHSDPGDDERVMRNLELFETELGVTDIIGLHGQDYLSPLVDHYNEETTGRGINYHRFRLSNFSQRDSIDERDDTLQSNIELFRTAHRLAHNAAGNVMTHCRHGRHRARTVWLVVSVLDNPPSFSFLSSYDGVPHYNELNDVDREQVDAYIVQRMEAIGIPAEEIGYLREAGDLRGQVGDIALNDQYRHNVLSY